MRVWDLPTRIYHWLQAIVFIGLVVSGITEEGPHVYLGLVLVTLLLWRVLWGIVGSETSRFSSFVRSPKDAINYLQGSYPETVGHNPAGGYMVIAMILALSLQALTGLALSGLLDSLPGVEYWLNDDIFDICVYIHESMLNILIALAVVHVSTIIIYKLFSKPLVWAMVTGYQQTKPKETDSNASKNSDEIIIEESESIDYRLSEAPLYFAPNWLALVILCIVASLVFLLYQAY